MTIICEMSLRNFKPWSGAVYTYNHIANADKLDEFEDVLEELYPDGIGETELNDLLWFDSDWCYETLNITTKEELEDELEDAKSRLADLEIELEGAEEDGDEDTIADCKANITEVLEEIAELESQIENW